MLARGEKVRGANVGGEHAFLDDAVSVVALHPVDPHKAVFLVENELGFYRLEVDRAAFLARLEPSRRAAGGIRACHPLAPVRITAVPGLLVGSGGFHWARVWYR